MNEEQLVKRQIELLRRKKEGTISKEEFEREYLIVQDELSNIRYENARISTAMQDPDFMQTPFAFVSPERKSEVEHILANPKKEADRMRENIRAKIKEIQYDDITNKDVARFEKDPREFLRLWDLETATRWKGEDRGYLLSNAVDEYQDGDLANPLFEGDKTSQDIVWFRTRYNSENSEEDYLKNKSEQFDYMGYTNNPFMNQINMDNANDFMQEGVGRLPLKPLEQIVSKEGKQPWETMSEADLKAYEESLNIPQANEEQVIGWMDKNYAPNPQEGVRPQNMEELKKAYVEGRLTRDAYNQMFDEFSTPTIKEEPNKNMLLQDAFSQYLPFMNPYGTDIGTELYSLGKFIGTKPGTQGKGLGIASSALSAGLGGARTLLSGLAQQKQTEKTAEEIRRQLAQRQFTPQTQYLNQNNRGGSTES